jgi:hypothetical protein
MAMVVMLLFNTGCSSDRVDFDDEGDPLPDYIDYNLHVRAILSDTCFACHGPDERAREADLRLDTEEGAFQPLTISEGNYAIVRGRPGQSELYRRIISDDPDYMMPVPQSNLSLSDRDIAILRKWIEQGAEYKPHWAFINPEKPDLPDVNDKEWPNTPVDYFVLEKLEEHGLQPSPEARKEKLLRRVSFDLTGLPPTVNELQQFLDDNTPDAYEKAVERLLNSDAYGERMAMDWLDVARYADTHGYQDDGANEMWPWREWVIHAFNRNMPFDEFITWQLAGDLLPDATREQKLATGFNRVHQQSQEGGIIGEEYRVEYVADRVQTTGTAFLGMTMQCARCHDHKYDPISELEYYEFAAFFDNINEAGQIPNEGASGPTILLPDEETDKLISYLENRIDEKEQELTFIIRNKEEDFLHWKEETRLQNFDRNDIAGRIARIELNEIRGDTAITFVYGGEQRTGRVTGGLNEVEGVFDRGLEFSHGNHINLGNVAPLERTDPFSLSFWINPEGNFDEVPVLVRLGQIFIGYRGYDVSLFNNRVSLRLIHGWPFNSIQALTEKELTPGEWSHITVTYDGSSRAEGIRIFINGQEDETRIEQDNLFKNIVIYDEAWYSNQDFYIGNRRSFENLNYQGLKLDEIQIYKEQLSPVEVLALSGSDDRLASLMTLQSEQLSPEQDQILFDHFLLRYDDEFAGHADQLRALRIEKSAVTDTLREVMVMGERLNPRQSYVRERGMYDQIGEKVSPGVPESILEFPDDLPRNRLGLAQWLLREDHPLTSRVLVNRYWQMMFGEGLVDTPEDFGNQGNMPSHPELLDWLAVYFRESGWDLKQLLRQIVLSRTYMQSSATTPEMREQDPGNRLLARGPRYRLQAEMIRDNALVASGLLVDEIGGPSVKPYQPEGLWEETTSGRHLTEYIRDEGDNLYRRSLYTFWKRTSPPPGMTTFDAAMRSHPTVKRGQTSTPLQALNTMNDPQYVEASRLLAERMIKEGGEDLKDQIIYAFLASTSRVPEITEIEILEDLFHSELMSFQEEPERAEALINVGDYPADDSIKAPELAARTLIASTILNLDETLTKE